MVPAPLKLAALFTLAMMSPGVSGAAAQDLGPQQPLDHYTIRAEVNVESRTIGGTVHIRWANRSRVPTQVLYFHLYLNAFANGESQFMKESGGSLRGQTLNTDGEIELESLRLSTGENLLEHAEAEVIPGDRTQLRVSLPRPVEPGDTINIESRFTSHMPEIRVRTGMTNGFVLGAQFFPKLARLEPNGDWASFPFHAFGEFYADFATYDLQLALPHGYQVGATGHPAEATDPAYPHRFIASPVHDVAFAAWDRFIVYEDEHEDIDIRFLAPPGYDVAVDAQMPTIGRALDYFSQHYGPYPHPSFTVILPPPEASGAAGMEYPTFVTSSGPWWDIPGVQGIQQETLVHEIAHQWFQGIVATHEVEWPMLDEGITTWAHLDYLAYAYGLSSSQVDWPRFQVDGYQIMRLVSRSRSLPPPGRPVYEFKSFRDLGKSVYGLSATALETVARTWGRDRLRQTLGAYARQYRFGRPVPQDLFDVFDAHYWPGFSAQVLEPVLMDGERGAVGPVNVSHDVNGGWNIVIVRAAGPEIPLHVEVGFDDGAVQRVPWPGSLREFRHEGQRPIAWVRVDPDGHHLLDTRPSNNVWMSSRHQPPTEAWFPRLVVLFSTLLQGLGP